MANDQVYQIVTDRVIKSLQEGTVPWHRPWRSPAHIPRSLSSKKPYRGINSLLLSLSDYESPWWGTYHQISELGGQVRKGEHGTVVVLWKWIERPTDDDPDAGFPMLRYFKVFNAEQAEWPDPNKWAPKKDESVEFDPIERAEEVFNDYIANRGPTLIYKGDRASYSPVTDTLTLPPRKAFESAEAFYSTAFHEAGHSTGHKSRLDRKELSTFAHFGDGNYSREELVAEITAAFTTAVIGIDTEHEQHQSEAYIKGWLKALRNDNRLVVTAAGQAQKASDLVLGETESAEEKEEVAA